YGNDIASAKDNLADAIIVNIKNLHKENRGSDIFSIPMDPEYYEAYNYYRKKRDESLMTLISEHILNPGEADYEWEIEKKLTYEIAKVLKLEINSERVKSEHETAYA
ncbi:MAG: hypothetical protein LBT84_06525, partial [Spirochaetia bacterium]|nr:hypothetical protein [Spirochaetia bacterium]